MRVKIIGKFVVGNPTIGQHHLLSKTHEGWKVDVLTVNELASEPEHSVTTYPDTARDFRQLLIRLTDRKVQEIMLPMRDLNEMNQLSKISAVQNLLEVDLTGISETTTIPQVLANAIW